MSVRSLLETATRRVVLRRRLPPDFSRAPIFVSPSAGLRYLFKPMHDVDPMLLSLVREFVKPGAVVWDVGANVGLLSMSSACAAGPTGNIIAFEPDAWLVQLLRRSAQAQSHACAPITVVPAAVAAQVAARTFVLAQRSSATNHLDGYGSTQTGGARERITVMAVTCDWLLTQFPAPDVLKIDVEGAEMEVLKGAAGLFEKHRPVVLIEVGEDTSPAVTKFFRDRGYRLFDADAPGPNRAEIEAATWMTIAQPGPR